MESIATVFFLLTQLGKSNSLFGLLLSSRFAITTSLNFVFGQINSGEIETTLSELLTNTNLAVDHVGAPPTLDKVRSNGQRQPLDRSPGHARSKFGGSSLPAG